MTQVSQWLSTNGGMVNTYQAYDIAGNPVISTDANGHTSSLSFSDNYSDGQNHGSYAQATSGNDAAGHGWSAQYDYASGKQIAVSGANGAFTYMQYNDSLDRLTKTTRPDGGITTVSYASPTVTVYCQDLNSTGDCTLQTERFTTGDCTPLKISDFSMPCGEHPRPLRSGQ